MNLPRRKKGKRHPSSLSDRHPLPMDSPVRNSLIREYIPLVTKTKQSGSVHTNNRNFSNGRVRMRICTQDKSCEKQKQNLSKENGYTE